MAYEMYRQPPEGESFNDLLAEQLRRTPWVLISAAVHGLVIVVLMAFMRDQPPPPPLEHAVMAMDEIEEVEDIPEEKEEIEEIQDVEETDTPELDEVADVIDETENETEYEEQGTEGEFSEGLESDSPDSPIGLGPGAPGGSFGKDRRGGKRNRRRGGTEPFVDRALDWLARHQAPDGSWDCDGFHSNEDTTCECLAGSKGHALYDVGVTGLALLCFLGAGETHRYGDYRHTVRRALGWLRKQQDSEGCFGARSVSNFTYNHAIGALAMAEAYGMTKSQILRPAAEAGIRFIHQLQNPYGAWRYGEANGQNDTSVTGWMVMALKSAKLSGLSVDDRSMKWALDWIDQMTDEETGRTGYTKKGEPPVREKGKQEEFPASESEALTAVAVLTRIFAGQDPNENAMIRLGIENVLDKKLPVWDRSRGSTDMYYWYYGTLAMYQVGGSSWNRWNRAMKEAVVESQRADGDFAGSWDPVGPWGEAGGRVYSTAVMTLCLEVYYRYGRVFGTK